MAPWLYVPYVPYSPASKNWIFMAPGSMFIIPLYTQIIVIFVDIHIHFFIDKVGC